jgi:hypothetical protein
MVHGAAPGAGGGDAVGGQVLIERQIWQRPSLRSRYRSWDLVTARGTRTRGGTAEKPTAETLNGDPSA